MGSSFSRAQTRLSPVWVAAFVAASLATANPEVGTSAPGPGGLVVGLRTGAATRDLLSVTDVRPVSRGEAIAEIELDYLLGEQWIVGVGGRVGGSWFDFGQVLLNATGNIRDQDLTLRGTIDHSLSRRSTTSTYVGMGVEYGQARSFTSTRFYDDEGPRTYYLGGLLRVGFTQPVFDRLQLHGELMHSVFRAHSVDASLAGNYHWLGRSLSMTVGVRAVLFRGRERRE